jgi:hypothetical protein
MTSFGKANGMRASGIIFDVAETALAKATRKGETK